MNDHDTPEFRKISRDLNSLYDWSIKVDEVNLDIENRRFAEYIAWKVPLPESYCEDIQVNRAIRSFCVERLICKLEILASLELNIGKNVEIIRFYCIASEPNLWASEVGLVFSEKKWEQLLYPAIETPVYSEKTERTDRTLLEAFGILKPAGIAHMHMSHTIEDREEEISFRGGLHVLWVDTNCARNSE